MKKRFVFLALAGLCTYALCACRSEGEGSVARLDAEEAAELKEELAARGAEGGTSQDEAADTYGEDVCYYLPSGGVWHADPACHHIAGKQNTVRGTVEAARAAGKSRPCSLCG